MIKKKEVFDCITIALTSLFVIGIITYMVHLQSKHYEGLTMNSKSLPPPDIILENLKKENENLDNELQINKYRDEYEDIILNYEELYYLNSLDRLINTNDNKKRREILGENALNVKALDDTAKFIFSH